MILGLCCRSAHICPSSHLSIPSPAINSDPHPPNKSCPLFPLQFCSPQTSLGSGPNIVLPPSPPLSHSAPTAVQHPHQYSTARSLALSSAPSSSAPQPHFCSSWGSASSPRLSRVPFFPFQSVGAVPGVHLLLSLPRPRAAERWRETNRPVPGSDGGLLGFLVASSHTCENCFGLLGGREGAEHFARAVLIGYSAPGGGNWDRQPIRGLKFARRTGVSHVVTRPGSSQATILLLGKESRELAMPFI